MEIVLAFVLLIMCVGVVPLIVWAVYRSTRRTTGRPPVRGQGQWSPGDSGSTDWMYNGTSDQSSAHDQGWDSGHHGGSHHGHHGSHDHGHSSSYDSGSGYDSGSSSYDSGSSGSSDSGSSSSDSGSSSSSD